MYYFEKLYLFLLESNRIDSFINMLEQKRRQIN